MFLENKTVFNDLKKKLYFSFIPAILLIILGIVLLINPDNFIPVAINVFGYVAIFLGILNFVFYFRLPKENKIYSKNLSSSILLIIFGIVAFLESNILKEIITLLIGSYIIYRNAKRIELAFCLEKSKLFYLTIILAIINLVLGFLIIINPFNNISINLYLGWMVIASEIILSIINILLLILLRKILKNEKEDA